MMDIDYNRFAVESIDADSQAKINFTYFSGFQGSAKEHQIPEGLFSAVDEPVHGISAVKALSIAVAQGQRIFTISQDNVDQLSSISLDADTRAEIQNAILTGKQVMVHENPINESGWTGTGYIILDPSTGSGAYKISGGLNGGKLLLGLLLLASILLIAGIILSGGSAIVLGGVLLSAGAHLEVISFYAITRNYTSEDWAKFVSCFFQFFFGLLGVFGGFHWLVNLILFGGSTAMGTGCIGNIFAVNDQGKVQKQKNNKFQNSLEFQLNFCA